MEAAVGRPGRRAVALAGALLAVGFMVAMVLSGHVWENKWLVGTGPGGVMREPPGEIDRVEIQSAGRRWVFQRASRGWRTEPGDRPVPASLAAHLNDSIKFMHVSAPVRVMERTEWAAQGLGEFGLDPPSYSAILFRGGQAVLSARFGAPNPQKVLQYMRLEGRDEVYLMSRFIGRAWERALGEAAGR